MDAVVLGLLAGAFFGAMTVAVRAGLFRGGDPVLGSVVITSSAFLVTALIACSRRGSTHPRSCGRSF